MITIYFDGLCQPVNPGGVATYGYVIYQDNKVIKKGYGVIGKGKGMTNNVAEYTALKKALQWVNSQRIKDKITVKGDSQLVINQLKGKWKVKSQTSKKFVPQIKELLRDKEIELIWIPREDNTEADRLCNIAYQEYTGSSKKE
ncbi:MAG: ribonuclease HI [Halobacteriota archaeon]